MLIEGESESEQIIKSMLIIDNLNPTYNLDFAKYLATVTGAGGPVGPGAVGNTAAYY